MLQNVHGMLGKFLVMRSITCQCALFIFVFSYLPSAFGVAIDLNDWAVNRDGVISENFAGDSLPGEGNFNLQTGLGKRTFEFASPGSHSLTAFFDHEIAVQSNFFTNEYGVVHGNPEPDQSWQVDEPGFVFGTIYDNLIDGSLNNTNTIPDTAPEDVSVAMGWEFALDAGEQAEVILNLKETRPDSGFFLEHVDPETGPGFDQKKSLFFSSELNITGSAAQVPGPPTWTLLLVGLFIGSGLRLRESMSYR
ncbi:hypothetical protein [Salicola sp. Rm-C-2C1-2]|uniref:hypothetical protein n=1 Tax=Salicola sp. Rm-C-2C1-2 TaxID=3141321 RepID=UPI0032E4A36B